MASVLQQYRRRANELPSGPYAIEAIARHHYRVRNLRTQQQVLNRVRLVEIGDWLKDERDRTKMN